MYKGLKTGYYRSMKNKTTTIEYKTQTFEVRPTNDNFHIFQDDQLVAIALTEDYIEVLIRDRVDYPNWTKKAGSRFD